jgi:actin-like ATPase involved in cell morphogenesis
MKVTALISDELIEKVKKISGGKNITESLVIALNDYVSRHTMEYLIDQVEQEPLVFREDFVEYYSNKKDRNQ